jgi:hypothetical protein
MRESSLKPAADQLDSLADQVLYSPTNEDRKLKAAFLALVDGNPLIDPSNLPMLEVERILHRKLPNKDSPGYAAWFLNKDENRQRLEYLFQLALGAAEDIILNTDPKAQGARVNMVKVVSELASKFPRQATGMAAGPSNGGNIVTAIASMDKLQLKALLEKGGQSFEITATKSSPNVIDVEPSDE